MEPVITTHATSTIKIVYMNMRTQILKKIHLFILSFYLLFLFCYLINTGDKYNIGG